MDYFKRLDDYVNVMSDLKNANLELYTKQQWNDWIDLWDDYVKNNICLAPYGQTGHPPPHP